MAQATFWFASPFKDWIGRRTLTLAWEGQATLRQIFLRLAADYPRLRENLPREGLQDESLDHMLAVILDGNFLSLDSIIPDGAKVDVLTPLAGGAGAETCRLVCLCTLCEFCGEGFGFMRRE
jgi:molybdopterin converting factor small subunit